MDKRWVLSASILFGLLGLIPGNTQAQAQSNTINTHRSDDSHSTDAKVKSWFFYSSPPAQSSSSASRSNSSTKSFNALATDASVKGSGTAGHIPKWIDSSTVHDSIITESGVNIGIDTTTPTSKLTVQGMIETTLGGYKFPDGTVQSTAGIPFVTHDASLSGNGTSTSVLGIALGGVNTIHLANGAVSGVKIANGSVVRSFNGLFDNVSLAAGSNITITPSGNTLTIAAPNSLSAIAHDTTLIGNGTSGSPLGVVNQGIGTTQLADNAVTSAKIAAGAVGAIQLADSAVTAAKVAPGQVLKSLNGLFDNMTLQAGANITITPSGNVLTIATSGLSPSIAHDSTLAGTGASGSPLGVAVPLFLNGSSDLPLISVQNDLDRGVFGSSAFSAGVEGVSSGLTGVGVRGAGTTGVRGFGDTKFITSNSFEPGIGVEGVGGDNDRIAGDGLHGTGGNSRNGSGGVGVLAEGGDGGLIGGEALLAFGGSGLSGYFVGDVNISGNLSKGGGSFKIDHPLDPANKYLYHSFVESPDMKNIYDGVSALDSNGEAVVQLPEWFQALNKDFRYQLTAIGAPGPYLHIAAKVANNRFKIAGGTAGMEVSWQVTGIRQDAYANANRIPVEADKSEKERGYYLHPDAFGQPEEKSIQWVHHPQLMQRIKGKREQARQKLQNESNR